MSELGDFMDELSSANTSTVRRLATRAVELERAIMELEGDLKQFRAELLEIRRERLPDAMAEIGFSEFKLEDGSGVKAKSFVAGSLPKSPIEKANAIRLLEQHGGDALIKNELVVVFEKKDHNRAIALAEELKAAGYDATLDSTVHHMQLAAWCREKVRDGEQLDFNALGIYVGRDTEIELSKKF